MLRSFLLATLLIFGPMHSIGAEPISADRIKVSDGDTISAYHYPPRVRLVGFNAPEIGRARCESERARSKGEKSVGRSRRHSPTRL